ncbi:MAG: DUF502 domain-containing protein [Verrucomicrobiota bacterium]
MTKSFLARWRSNFLTGLVVLLPAVISIAVVVWLFRNVSDITDKLLFFLPPDLTHKDHGKGGMHWYWSVAALLFAVGLICAVGLLARNYIGRKLIEWMDRALLQIPLLNKIYGATKQVNDALTSGDKNSFKTVVMIEFPHPGSRAIGFLTSEQRAEPQIKSDQNLVCVFIPTTPNPTSGFLMLVPEEKVTRLEMSVSDGLKYIISLGAIAPPFEKKP